GAADIGIVSFGYEGTGNSDNPAIRYHTRSSGGSLCTGCGKLWSTSTSTNRSNLISRVSEVQANPANSGFSDIAAGLSAGNNLFSATAANKKFLVLLTDGYANMPASGS